MERLNLGQAFLDGELLLVGATLRRDLPALAETTAPPFARKPAINVGTLEISDMFKVSF